MPVLLKVRDWDKHFENNRTRELKHMDWVPIPNKHDGDGYTQLVDHPDGAAHFGAWVAIVEVASKCIPRGTLVRDGGAPHDASSLARITRIHRNVFEAAIPRLIAIGWLTSEVVVSATDTEIPHEGAGTSQDGAALTRARRTERKGTEESPPPPDGGEPAGFVRFWSAWPNHRRKADKARCLRKWNRAGLEAVAEQVVAGLLRWKASRDWEKQGGDFIPAPLAWLNQERWKVPESAFAEQASAAGDADNGFVRRDISDDEAESILREIAP